MANFINVVIGIQARSTSKRFPRKVFETIDGKPMLKHVIDACNRSTKYMNNYTQRTKTLISVALVIPYDDEIGSVFRRQIDIVEGPEDDVLTRYKMLADKFSADYIVRVTGDCPLIPPFLITKHIKTAIVNDYDYVSNVDEDARTAADGVDVEVMSANLLKWLDENAQEGPDREHVTLLARRAPPDWAKRGHIIGHMDLSHMKLSVDSMDDLERVRAEYERTKRACDNAEKKFGKPHTHRF